MKIKNFEIRFWKVDTFWLDRPIFLFAFNIYHNYGYSIMTTLNRAHYHNYIQIELDLFKKYSFNLDIGIIYKKVDYELALKKHKQQYV